MKRKSYSSKFKKSAVKMITEEDISLVQLGKINQAILLGHDVQIVDGAYDVVVNNVSDYDYLIIGCNSY